MHIYIPYTYTYVCIYIHTHTFTHINICMYIEKQMAPLCVSEFLGCSRVLSGSFSVNPWNVDCVVDAVEKGLQLSQTDRQTRLKRLYQVCLCVCESMCLCVLCVCVCVCVHVCMCMCMCMCTLPVVSACLVCVSVCVHVCVHVYNVCVSFAVANHRSDIRVCERMRVVGSKSRCVCVCVYARASYACRP